MYTIAIISFFIGVVLSALVTYIILSKNALAKTEELAKLKVQVMKLETQIAKKQSDYEIWNVTDTFA